MPDPLTVTAIVPSYGRPDSLLRCLEGLVGGERVPDEIVVVLREADGASREAFGAWERHRGAVAGDRTVTAPTGIGERHRGLVTAPTGGKGRLRLVLVAEAGQVAALNAGLAVATGDIVTFPDDDCVPRADWLRRLMGYYDDPLVGGAGGRDVVHHATPMPPPPVVHIVGKLTWYGRVIGNHHCETPGGPRAVDHLKGVNMSFRRDLLPPFDPLIRGPHFNDTDVALGVSGAGWRLIYDHEAKVDHYPAARLDNPGGRDLQDPQLVYLDAHDWMYIALKRQPWALKGVSACYILLVGTRLRPGLLTGPFWGWRSMAASVRGAVAGVGTWFRARRTAAGGTPAPRDTGP